MVFNTLAITQAKISKVADKENLIIIMVKDKHNWINLHLKLNNSKSKFIKIQNLVINNILIKTLILKVTFNNSMENLIETIIHQLAANYKIQQITKLNIHKTNMM